MGLIGDIRMLDVKTLRREWAALLLGTVVALTGQMPAMSQDPPKDPPTKKRPIDPKAQERENKAQALLDGAEPAGPEVADRCTIALRRLYGDANPVRVPAALDAVSSARKIPGTGVYLRTDYWVQLTSGGSLSSIRSWRAI